MPRSLWCALAAFLPLLANAETGVDAWLRYAPLHAGETAKYRAALPAVVVVSGKSPLVDSAANEFIRGARGMLGRTLRLESQIPSEGAIVITTARGVPGIDKHLQAPELAPDGYWLKTVHREAGDLLLVAGAGDRGALYGAFALLRKIATGESIKPLDEVASPAAPIRWVNQWDNLDGTIERGYGGHSMFWEQARARTDLSRVAEYGRLLASLGINGCTVNNVNADARVLTSEFLPELARVAEALRPWGVRISISIDFGSPQSMGGLSTFDPLDSSVAAWWQAKVDEVYRFVPDLAGFVLKADSEGRVGPSAYGRTHADAANVVARALKPHGGILLYRGFVYDHHMDWRNPKNDRARAAYDNFHSLDGAFDDNVVVQIKNGPIDFQVREPVSPLFGALERTNVTLELQVTQEYMGQARHMVFLVPQWKEVLDFDLEAKGRGTPMSALASGKVFKRPLGGFVGVADAGLSDSWFGSHLSQANLYGFGRLAWNPHLTSLEIAREWTRLTFGNNPRVVDTITEMLLSSWRTYESYTGPLGLQTLTDIVGNHFGVAVEASEHNGWGQWHRADHDGVGMDRSVATGTGFAGQYRPGVAKLLEAASACPDDLLLFFHHVPYTYKLHSGKTVIQSIYDSHYEGAETAAGYVETWKLLSSLIDEQRYREVLRQLEYQAGHAVVWRDAVTRWFLRESGIPDASARVGNYPGRFEAESMQLTGYEVVDVVPWEAASGGKAVTCPKVSCTASLLWQGPDGWYRLNVQYFDQNNGSARFRLLVGDQEIDAWTATDHIPTAKIDGSSSTRRVIPEVALRRGDEIRIVGEPDGGETAAIDYLEAIPEN
jgi:alpha-glucuronidase